VCRTCGPVTLDPGFASPPSLRPPPPALALAPPPVAPAAPTAPTTLAVTPAFSAPPWSTVPVEVPPPLKPLATAVAALGATAVAAVSAKAATAAAAGLARIEGPPPRPRPRPQGEAKPDRQSKAQRRRAAMAGRTASAPTPTIAGLSAEPVLGLDTDEPPLTELVAPRPITLIGRLNLFVGASDLLTGWAITTGRLPMEGTGALGFDHGVLFFAWGALTLAAAFGLFLLKPFGWNAELGLLGARVLWGSWSNLVGIPIAIYLLRPGVRLVLSGRDPRTFSPGEHTRVRSDTKSPALVPITVAVLGLMAAIRLLVLLFTARWS
jgi:hypothetical protein